MKTDFRVRDEGTIALLFPLTDAAKEWVEEKVEVAQTWSGGVVIDHRFVQDILDGIVNDGLTVEA